MPSLTSACTTGLTRFKLLTDTNLRPDPDVLILTTPYEFGGDREQAFTVPASVAFLEKWPKDVHFAQYATPSGCRVNKSFAPRPPLAFGLVALDLDYADHLDDRPTPEDFDDLVRTWAVMDHTPNVVYPTRGGARAVYLLDPVIADADEFEARRAAFVEIQAPLYEAAMGGRCKYRLDPCRDWTRLFRCPRVVRGDGTNLHHTAVRVFPGGALDLTKLRVRARPKPEPAAPTSSATLECYQFDDKLARLRQKIEPGQRNRYLYSCVRHVAETYQAGAAEHIIADLVRTALAAGLDQHEVDTTVASARKVVS